MLKSDIGYTNIRLLPSLMSPCERGKPAAFLVNGIIAGWIEGLQLMKEELYIRAELTCGGNPAPSGKIKLDMALIFEVELLSIAGK